MSFFQLIFKIIAIIHVYRVKNHMFYVDKCTDCCFLPIHSKTNTLSLPFGKCIRVLLSSTFLA